MKKQRGLSFIGFVCLAIVVGVVFLVGAQAVPAHNEFFAVRKVLGDVAKSVGAGGSKQQFSQAFDLRSDVDGITSVKGADIRVTKAQDGTELTIEYEKRQKLAGHVSMVFEFVAKATAK
jgi:hypothetical protein